MIINLVLHFPKIDLWLHLVVESAYRIAHIFKAMLNNTDLEYIK